MSEGHGAQITFCDIVEEEMRSHDYRVGEITSATW